MTKQQIVSAVVAAAKKEIGVRESDNNSGARVRDYQASTTLGGTHWPWCAAYVSWAIRQGDKAADIKIPWSHSASCDVLWADGKSRGLMRSKPEVGDVFLVKARKGSGYSSGDAIHTGIVIAVNGSKFSTVEGNTNSGGGREGVAVMSHERVVSERFAFIRWIDGVQNARIEEPKPLPWKVLITDRKGGVETQLKAFYESGTNYIGAKEFADYLGVAASWDGTNGEVSVGVKPVPEQPRMVDKRAYFPVRTLVEHVGLSVTADLKSRIVRIGPK